ICWEWLLREEDHGNPMIRATLNLDEGEIPQHGVDEIGMSWEELLIKRIEDNQRRMVELNKELTDLAMMVGGCLDEEKDDVEDVEDVGPLLAILPPVDPHQDVPFLQVNPKYLYNLVTPFRAPWWVVSEICGQMFGIRECFFGPRSQVDNMGMLFATTVFMYFEKRSTRVVKRICFSPLYAAQVLEDSRRKKMNHKVWTLNDYVNFFHSEIIGFHDIVNVEFVSAIK
ncbi:hypothetical protein V8G54_019590, partial [Vigna mungo]